MKTKSLITGALPLPFTGPWVRIDDAERWSVKHPSGIAGGGRVEVVVQEDVRTAYILNGEPFEIFGQRARVVVEDEIEGISEISVTLEEVH